jgi:hypothetical protein
MTSKVGATTDSPDAIGGLYSAQAVVSSLQFPASFAPNASRRLADPR